MEAVGSAAGPALAAWLASWAPAPLPGGDIENFAAYTSPFAQHCRDALTALPPTLANKCLADMLSWDEWLLQLLKKFQALLNR